MDEPTSVPSAFEARKTKILADLAIPDAEYTDLSPKGSVDEGIRDLIRDINGLPGLVTTSSCAGRISVFLEGRKKQPKASEEQQQQQQQQRQFVPSGGKGAGKWLYVSHDPLEEKATSLHERFSLNPGDGRPLPMDKAGRAPRLVRFHYEPMILHIMAATLHHASPVLSAASSSGFRESGLQSLRCLDGDDDGPSPIVAVRSAGLSLESVIGYCEDADEDEDGKEPVIYSLVTEEYLQMLVAISNERFSINAERKARFRTSLLQLCSPSEPASSKTKGKLRPPGWEDPEKRRERKRAEGLMRKKLLEDQMNANESHHQAEPTEEFPYG
ncbi:methyltransferase TYW3-domain-containing protein [Aspergillus ambiguus]|uniref:tRNA wybutosine-synthesizing 3 family protein n=1 Tax=Aspergillus ambiguus TaxID=176160 RepID=UPI003CCE0EA4